MIVIQGIIRRGTLFLSLTLRVYHVRDESFDLILVAVTLLGNLCY